MADVALDACCLINLLAAGRILDPAFRGPALGLTLHVPQKAVEETLYLLKPDADGASVLVKAEIDLGPCFAAGLVHRCAIEGPAESDLFVRLAVWLDDGEAECLAIARQRGWLMATDDRPARRLARDLGVDVLSTAEVVKRWAERTGAADELIRQVLGNIETYARFTPRRNSPEYSWWMSKLP